MMTKENESVGWNVIHPILQFVRWGDRVRIELEDFAGELAGIEGVAEEVTEEANGGDECGHELALQYPTDVAATACS